MHLCGIIPYVYMPGISFHRIGVSIRDTHFFPLKLGALHLNQNNRYGLSQSFTLSVFSLLN